MEDCGEEEVRLQLREETALPAVPRDEEGRDAAARRGSRITKLSMSSGASEQWPHGEDFDKDLDKDEGEVDLIGYSQSPEFQRDLYGKWAASRSEWGMERLCFTSQTKHNVPLEVEACFGPRIVKEELERSPSFASPSEGETLPSCTKQSLTQRKKSMSKFTNVMLISSLNKMVKEAKREARDKDLKCRLLQREITQLRSAYTNISKPTHARSSYLNLPAGKDEKFSPDTQGKLYEITEEATTLNTQGYEEAPVSVSVREGQKRDEAEKLAEKLKMNSIHYQDLNNEISRIKQSGVSRVWVFASLLLILALGLIIFKVLYS